MRIIRRVPKRKRQEELRRVLEENPFLTDEELARRFTVSVQTIRLDRMEMGVPELRERLRQVAEQNFGKLRALEKEEVIGEIIDLRLDESGISILTIQEEHVFSRTKIARGHHIFAQANSLAVALSNAQVALTANASIRFIRPVKLGEKLVAKARVVDKKKKGFVRVRVDTYVQDELVFTGDFLIYKEQEKAMEQELEGGLAVEDRN